MPRVDLFLAGDVMTGRAIDQILPHPSSPELYERHVRDARDYIRFAEEVNGPVPRCVDVAYPWGDALEELRERRPDARIVNLETSITVSDEPWPDKGIHYRMHPRNVGCLAAAGLDLCVLANNHVLDWGRAGLVETLESLHRARIATVGAGRTSAEATEAARLELGSEVGVVVAAAGERVSGVPPSWEATDALPGVAMLASFDRAQASAIVERVARVRRRGDLAIASIHWGSNWGWSVPKEHVELAHALIDLGIDLVHGHSSHHPRPIELYRGKPILYGCGDLLNDYEGIRGHEEHHGDRVLMYFATFEDGRFVELRMVPMALQKLRLGRASVREGAQLWRMLAEVSRPFGTAIAWAEDALFVRAR